MIDKPLVSVIVPLYNAAAYLSEAFGSIYAQTYSNLEIIAINDGSTDDTAERIRPFLDRPAFRYIEQPNKGVSAARNVGLRAATGDFIAFLDHDDQWLPEKIEKQLGYFQANPDAGLVHGNIEFMDATGDPLPREISNFRTDISGWCFGDLFFDNRIATTTVCIRRETASTVGFFREDIRGGEDYEYWLRVAKSFRIGWINENLARYRLHGSNATRNWLPQLVDLSRALEGILDQFPEMRSKFGPKELRDRLLPIHMRIAREKCRVGDFDGAKPHLAKILRLQPVSPHAWKLLALSSLPAGLRTALRWYAHKLFG